jgi:amidohydrolase
MKERIKSLAQKHHAEVVAFRRHLHAHPELSFEEFETAEFIKSVLRSNGVTFTDGLAGGTGIIADIGQGERIIALRADMDALPIQEDSDQPYTSQNNGVMHACGHDVHTSSLLGTLLILKEIESELSHRIRFIFQPGEERLPGGASMMIQDGALDSPQVDLIYGQHVHPTLPAGQVGIRGGSFMASCDELYISIIGSGGHGAMPQDTIDPILISAEVIQSLQSVISRSANPNIPSVLTIGKINSVGGATNVIPDKVMMEGTFRTFDETWRSQAHQLIAQRIEHIVSAHGAQAEVEIMRGYPSLYNSPTLTEISKNLMIDYLGANNVIELPPRMTAEDFSYYSQKIPACFYRLGTSSTDGRYSSPVHTSTFDIDENALLHGMGLMAWLAFQNI